MCVLYENPKDPWSPPAFKVYIYVCVYYMRTLRTPGAPLHLRYIYIYVYYENPKDPWSLPPLHLRSWKCGAYSCAYIYVSSSSYDMHVSSSLYEGPEKRGAYSCAYICIYTHINVYLDTCIYIYLYTDTQTHRHTVHTHRNVYTYTYTHTHTHTHTHTGAALGRASVEWT